MVLVLRRDVGEALRERGELGRRRHATVDVGPRAAREREHAADDELAAFFELDTRLFEARGDRGVLHDEEFADKILDLFVRADSLATILCEDPARARRDIGTFALKKSVLYLIESLRENYVGIVGQNGVRFVEADLALKAAVAWRSGASSPSATP